MTIEREAAFDFFGPRTLVGPELKAGDPAPDFVLLNNKLKEVRRSDFAGKPMLISVVPSLDTSVCSMQSVRFEEEAANLGDALAVITVSADLPFAQARWCSAHDAKNSQFLSDHRDMSFGTAYGTYLRDFRIESRAVFVIDKDGIVRYAEYVPVAGNQPDYVAALAAVQSVL